MLNFSQNKKIAVSAVALFIVSFSVMLFFLNGENLNPEHLKTTISGETSNHEETAETVPTKGLENLILDIGFVTDLEGVITKTNLAFCGLLSEKCKNLVGKKLFDLVNKDDVGELVATYVKLVQEDKKIESIGPLRLSDGAHDKLLIFSALPLKDDAGKVIQIRFSLKDITEKVQELNESEAVEEQSEENTKKSWIERIYPKIRDLNEQGNKLLVKTGNGEKD